MPIKNVKYITSSLLGIFLASSPTYGYETSRIIDDFQIITSTMLENETFQLPEEAIFYYELTIQEEELAAQEEALNDETGEEINLGTEEELQGESGHEFETESDTESNHQDPNVPLEEEFFSTASPDYIEEEPVTPQIPPQDAESAVENEDSEIPEKEHLEETDWESPFVADTFEEWVSSFGDVSVTDWYATYIYYVTENDMISGHDGNFYPGGNCTRGVIAHALATLSGTYLDYNQESQFTDSIDSPYQNGIDWCVENGIMSGFSDTVFGIDDPMTREELAVALLAFSKYQNVYFNPTETRFSYSDISHISKSAYPAMVWAVENSLLSGSQQLLAPQAFVSRAELSTILHKYTYSQKDTYYNRDAIANFALSMLGYPYAYGGSSPLGFECIGFAYYVYLAFGLEIPSTIRAAYSAGSEVSMSEIQPGDLFFFGSYSHAAIYLGADKFIHANTTSMNVTIWNFSNSYFKSSFLAARRYF